jgi:hypothetical protein
MLAMTAQNEKMKAAEISRIRFWARILVNLCGTAGKAIFGSKEGMFEKEDLGIFWCFLAEERDNQISGHAAEFFCFKKVFCCSFLVQSATFCPFLEFGFAKMDFMPI